LANTKSAIKHIRTSDKRRIRNRRVKSAARTYVKNARSAIITGHEDATETLTAAIRALDKAAQKGVIHRNNAARRKARLVKLLRGREAAAS
jgi:small subunit ribosomal protein S20